MRSTRFPLAMFDRLRKAFSPSAAAAARPVTNKEVARWAASQQLAIVPQAQRIAPWGWHLQLLMPPQLLAEQCAVLQQLPVPLAFWSF